MGLLKWAAEAMAKMTRCKINVYCGKMWWVHPTIKLGAPLRQIGVKLTDLTTGDVRWDAVYMIEPGTLKAEDLPVGGSHPFFQPDWCPPPGDFMAHKFRLTVKNYDPDVRAGMDVAGQLYFTLYSAPLLANTYQFENSDESFPAVPPFTDADECNASTHYEPRLPCDVGNLRSCDASIPREVRKEGWKGKEKMSLEARQRFEKFWKMQGSDKPATMSKDDMEKAEGAQIKQFLVKGATTSPLNFAILAALRPRPPPRRGTPPRHSTRAHVHRNLHCTASRGTARFL